MKDIRNAEQTEGRGKKVQEQQDILNSNPGGLQLVPQQPNSREIEWIRHKAEEEGIAKMCTMWCWT